MLLRRQAEALLRVGAAPKAKGVVSAEALAMLHRMVSVEEGSDIALKLLHELQVHQVELDMQQEQLEQTRDELAQALERYVERYEFAPFAYFNVDRHGKIIEGNRAAAELSGMEQDALCHRPVDSLVIPQCQLTLRAMLKRLGHGGSREACVVQVQNGGTHSRYFQVVAAVSPSDQCFMLAFIPMAAPAA